MASSALERVSTDSEPRSTQQANRLRLPPRRRTRSSLRTDGSAPAISSRSPLPSPSSFAACSMRHLPPVSTTIACGRLGVGLGAACPASPRTRRSRAPRAMSRKEARRAIIIARAMPQARWCAQPASRGSRRAAGRLASRTRSTPAQQAAVGPVAERAEPAAGDEQQDERGDDRARGAADQRVDRDLALEQAGDLQVGGADAVHHLDRRRDGCRARRASPAPPRRRWRARSARRAARRSASARSSVPSIGASRDWSAMNCAEGTARLTAAATAAGSAPGASSTSISAGSGRSAPSPAATGPSHCSSVARSSASGTATALVTPGAARAAATARASLARPSAIWIE